MPLEVAREARERGGAERVPERRAQAAAVQVDDEDAGVRALTLDEQVPRMEVRVLEPRIVERSDRAARGGREVPPPLRPRFRA
jgi:hypothetical protein